MQFSWIQSVDVCITTRFNSYRGRLRQIDRTSDPSRDSVTFLCNFWTTEDIGMKVGLNNIIGMLSCHLNSVNFIKIGVELYPVDCFKIYQNWFFPLSLVQVTLIFWYYLSPLHSEITLFPQACVWTVLAFTDIFKLPFIVHFVSFVQSKNVIPIRWIKTFWPSTSEFFIGDQTENTWTYLRN